ncbi:hypothetical protein CRUP_018577 [Coryphaenoides rupestris]|nr:hypothetical protein CRUP_018577 [Coryphaenoides rupestris]
MLSPATLRTLLLLAALCVRSGGGSTLCLRLAGSDLLCDRLRNQEQDQDRDRDRDQNQNQNQNQVLSAGDYWGSPPLFGGSGEETESRGKRTSHGQQPNYRILSQTQTKVLQDRRSGDRRSKLTLSLDVPTHIMNVLFDMAKAKKLRAKAADNARLLAHIGRRK